jgi:hypothetical protein
MLKLIRVAKFVNVCDQCSMCYNYDTQAKQFLETFHENRKSKVSLLLDGERWKQADVPAEIQALVQKLETGKIPLNCLACI